MDGTEPTIQSLLSNTSTGGSTKIDGSTITTGQIRSNNWSTTLGSELDLNAGTITLGGSTSPKFIVQANGDVTGSSVNFTGGTFSGTVTVGGTALTEANTLNSNTTATNVGLGSVENLNAQSQAQTGLISGTTITGGGITLSGGGSIKGGQSAFNTGTGFFLGYESSAYKFSIGNTSTNYLTWDGSTFAVGGTIAATAGNIGGFTISNNSLSNGSDFYISGSATGNGFFISSSKFNVKANGDVTASAALFSGNVTAVNFSKKLVTVTNINSASFFQTVSGGINLIFDGSFGGETAMVMEIACPTNPTLNIKNIIVPNTGAGLMPQVEVIISQNNVTFDTANIKIGTALAVRTS